VTTPGSGVVAGRPQPQTTVEAPGGPFIRHTQAGRRTQYQQASVALGGLVANPLVAAPGYTRGYRVKIAGSGGTGTNTTTADNLGNICSLVQLKDSFGTPLIVAPGYEALNIIQMFGGQFGINQTCDVNNLPGTAALAAGVNAGAFTLSTYLPLEFAKAYGVISSANASLLPTLQFNVNTGAIFYGTTTPATAPTMTFTVDQDFYWLPEGVSVQPPGLGTTEQWVYQPANPTIGSAATLNVQLPRLGGYLSVIIAELRDSAAARTTTGTNNGGWGTRTRFLVDGVPLIDTLDTTWQDDMAIAFGTGSLINSTAAAAGTNFVNIPTGIRVVSFKNSLGSQSQGLFDTGESYLSTNPGTQIEFAGAPWGGVTSGPATLNAICGQVVPSGAMIQGLPEV
jgi:hypothetical protein